MEGAVRPQALLSPTYPLYEWASHVLLARNVILPPLLAHEHWCGSTPRDAEEVYSNRHKRTGSLHTGRRRWEFVVSLPLSNVFVLSSCGTKLFSLASREQECRLFQLQCFVKDQFLIKVGWFVFAMIFLVKPCSFIQCWNEMTQHECIALDMSWLKCLAISSSWLDGKIIFGSDIRWWHFEQW